MPLGGLQDELDYILGRRTQRYWVAYLLGIPTAFIYPLIWMANIAEELRAIALAKGIEGPYTSWWHMFGWNTFGLILMGPAVATWRFFDTLNKIEARMYEDSRAGGVKRSLPGGVSAAVEQSLALGQEKRPKHPEGCKAFRRDQGTESAEP